MTDNSVWIYLFRCSTVVSIDNIFVRFLSSAFSLALSYSILIFFLLFLF